MLWGEQAIQEALNKTRAHRVAGTCYFFFRHFKLSYEDKEVFGSQNVSSVFKPFCEGRSDSVREDSDPCFPGRLEMLENKSKLTTSSRKKKINIKTESERILYATSKAMLQSLNRRQPKSQLHIWNFTKICLQCTRTQLFAS